MIKDRLKEILPDCVTFLGESSAFESACFRCCLTVVT